MIGTRIYTITRHRNIYLFCGPTYLPLRVNNKIIGLSRAKAVIWYVKLLWNYKTTKMKNNIIQDL